MAVDEDVVTVTVKWNGKEYEVGVHPDECVEGLKRKLEARTAVQPKRQKLLGLKTIAGKLPGSDTLVRDLAIKPNAKIVMMG